MRLWLLSSIALVAVAAALTLSPGGGARATSFTPVLATRLSDTTPGANADVSVWFQIPAGSANFSTVVAFVPPEFFVASGADIPDGAYVADVRDDATLGLLNNPCSQPIQVSFQLFDASTEPSRTVHHLESFWDGDGNTLPDGIDLYPQHLNALFPGLVPRMRMYGQARPGDVDISLNFLVFEPGTALPNMPPFDPSLGYPFVTVLNDPTFAIASAMTDFCPPVGVTRTFFGVSRDNPATTADEGGVTVLANPEAEGDYAFTAFVRSTWDADGDGIDNGLDTCPLDVNAGSPFEAGSGDDDGDGLDNACDPVPGVTEVDLDQDDDGILNRGDNCPLVVDPMGFDADTDGIGDACDPNPYQPDGQAEEVTLTSLVHIGPQDTAASLPSAGGDAIRGADAGRLPSWALYAIALSAPLVLGGGIAVAGVVRSRRGE